MVKLFIQVTHSIIKTIIHISQIEAITQKYKALQKQLEDNSVEVVDTVRKYVETVLMPQKAEIEAQFADIQTYFDKNDKVSVHVHA